MILTPEQIKSVTTGAIQFEPGKNGGIVPRRFTSKQMEVYRPGYDPRQKAASGVCLALSTDASAFTLKFCCAPGSSRDFYGIDAVIDGDLYSHYEGSFNAPAPCEWTVALPRNFASLRIYLPCFAEIELLYLELSGATAFSPLPKAPTILFHGDSITQGYISHFPYLTYTAQTALMLGCDHVNQGIGGDVFRPEAIDPDSPLQPDLIVVAYGTNDWRHTDRSTLAENSEKFITKLQNTWPGIPIIMISPIWRADRDQIMPGSFRFDEVLSTFTALAAAHPGVYVIPGEDLVPHIRELMQDAYLHPNELGFIWYAKNLSTAMKSLIPDMFNT